MADKNAPVLTFGNAQSVGKGASVVPEADWWQRGMPNIERAAEGAAIVERRQCQYVQYVSGGGGLPR
jgi:hypothetical protein